MKLKVVEKGYQNFTGYMGSVEFVGGVSKGDVALNHAQRIAASIKVEYEDGTNPSTAQAILDNYSKPAQVVEPMTRGQDQVTVENSSEGQVAEAGENVESRYTRESLEAIADKQGISGVREIANEFGVRSKSIGDLIDGILAAQGK